MSLPLLLPLPGGGSAPASGQVQGQDPAGQGRLNSLGCHITLHRLHCLTLPWQAVVGLHLGILASRHLTPAQQCWCKMHSGVCNGLTEVTHSPK